MSLRSKKIEIAQEMLSYMDAHGYAKKGYTADHLVVAALREIADGKERKIDAEIIRYVTYYDVFDKKLSTMFWKLVAVQGRIRRFGWIPWL